MTPRLRVLAGTSLSHMETITDLVNTNKSHKLSSDLFDGEIVAHIKGMTDEDGNLRDSEYFSREERQGVTWSIQVQGRFQESFSSDDILFGNTFDHPLKLPWGTSAVLKFMNYIDPTLQHDLTSQAKPWALSPLISTMPHFAHKRSCLVDAAELTTSFPPVESLEDSTEELHLTMFDDNKNLSSPSSSTSSLSSSSASSDISSSSAKSSASAKLRQAFRSKKSRSQSGSPHPNFREEVKHLEDASQRRSYFAVEEHRKAVTFGPDDLVTTDFCYGFINFTPTLSLQLPGGLSFDLMRYWDGQPVRFVCCERKRGDDASGEPWGRVFWCIAIEVVDDA
ncbi:hypothetical protein CPB83DRAFT_851276 [Crepidotus variabilis]|uniref:Domain of unknown function at the cortex 1 domain-containing protein n=1 Tax=Crepidotus variabilis TaxID=179855 RepID=A0A9P6JRV2_9AGAR|nr:hypothetical protein CPB83DRAFT_851276 [Crepidotus variabilis]